MKIDANRSADIQQFPMKEQPQLSLLFAQLFS